MKAVLGVDRELALAEAEGVKNASGKTVSAVSAAEQPGVHAPATVNPDLPPVKGKPLTPARDYDYKRMGTAAILAALNLQPGQVSARVERLNRSRGFIALPRQLVGHYPDAAIVRIILGNRSLDISNETRAYPCNSASGGGFRWLGQKGCSPTYRQGPIQRPVPRR